MNNGYQTIVKYMKPTFKFHADINRPWSQFELSFNNVDQTIS